MSTIIKNIGVITLSLLLHLYFYSSEHIEKFDYKFYDTLSKLSSIFEPEQKSFYSVIVDIDEKSLDALGQWPWPRVIDAQLIDAINELHPSAIGVNILFPEEDRVSPLYIQKFYQRFFNVTLSLDSFPESLKDNDRLLWKSIFHSNATIATYLDNRSFSKNHCDELSYKKNTFSNIDSSLTATSLHCNYPTIQHDIENFGFINAWSDSDGILRRVPLFMRYEDKVFPSLAVATLLSFDTILGLKNQEDTILVKFSKRQPKRFSAIDILMGRVDASEIQGKIVIVGSSVVGLSPRYIISNGERISNNMIHAFVIDNILTNQFLTQPKLYKQINILFSALLTLLVIIFFSKRNYLYMVISIITMLLFSLLWLIHSYVHGTYISIGYLWIPFTYIFVLILIYHIWMINQERQAQENLLIRQNKLASMGEMIALIAHQWRQPLSVINGIVLNIDIDDRKKLLDRERLDEHLNKIEETTNYLSKTINDFTDFFSTTKRKDTFYISDIIKQVKQLSGLSKHKNIEIIYRSQKEIKVVGYRSELIQSILIILNNAIYAVLKNIPKTDKGKIVIEAEVVENSLLISIEDNGGGISNKDMKKIFDPYFTTKEKAHGTGLGLYILKMIVEDSMNGRISILNAKEGAKFIIKIPMEI